MGKNTPSLPISSLRYFQKTSQVTTSIACSNFKAPGKISHWFMRPKSEIFNFELLFLATFNSRKAEQYFSPEWAPLYATLHRLSRIGKQYANRLEEYDTWSQVFNQTFEVLLAAARFAARLSELPTRWSNSCQRKRVQSVLSIRLLLNSEQSQTDLWGIRRTSI